MPDFPDIPPRPYFPFCLGNGVDSVMLDYSGSMHCDSGHLHTEQHEGAICCWQKIAHRRRGRLMVPLAQFPYRVRTVEGELYEVGRFEQRFDAAVGLLTTRVVTSIVTLRVESMLLRDQSVYVERFTVLRIRPGTRVAVDFIARRPPLTVPGLAIAYPAEMRVAFAVRKPCVVGSYRLDGVRGSFAMTVRATTARPRFSADAPRDRQADACGMATRQAPFITVAPLRTGQVITRCISLLDAPITRTRALSMAGLNRGFEPLGRAQRRLVRHHGSRIELPDDELMRQHDLCHWLLTAWQDPRSGFITTGPFGAFKGGGHANYWDLFFSARALAASDRIADLKKLLDFYQDHAAQAKRYARQLGQPGLYYPWFADCRNQSLDFDRADENPGIQKWNNACVAIQLLMPYFHAGDAADARRRLGTVRGILDFLLASIVRRTPRGCEVAPLQGADENVDRRNDTAHLLTLLRALEDYVRACDELSVPVPQAHRAIPAALHEALRRNYCDGVLMPFAGTGDYSSENFTFECLWQPRTIGRKSLMASLRNSRGEWGLTNAGTYRNLVWPWTESRAAMALAFHEPGLAWRRLRHVTRITTSLGFFPEKVRPDGFWVLPGYLSAHATFLGALLAVLACDDGRTLKIAAGLPRGWSDLRFTDVRTPSGLRVSFEMRHRVVRRLVIANDHARPRRMRVQCLGRDFPRARITATLDLSPGEHRVV